MATRSHARSIAWPIFALVIASVVCATAVLFVVTFSGPPPSRMLSPFAALASALKTGRQPIMGETLVITRSAVAPAPRPGEAFDPMGTRLMADRLNVAVGEVRAFRGDRGGMRGLPFGPFTFALHQGDFWRIVRNPERPFFTHWHWKTLAAMLIAILVLSLPAWLIARTISRPLRQLAFAADQARAGAALGALPIGGSREVRDLTSALSTMHERLAAHARTRTTMLGAIAHDLGTPVSRLAFWIEQLPEAARLRASADIDEMRAMIAATLVFARDESAEMTTSRIDLGSLLDALVEDLNIAGEAVTMTPGPRAIVRGDSGSLRRIFTNLIQNGVRYGESADLAWAVEGGVVTVTIDDRGPRLDPAQLDRLFDPFVRGDPSRNRATGGTGLGLAIVRAHVGRHGGTATLMPGPTGMRAQVTLPLA